MLGCQRGEQGLAVELLGHVPKVASVADVAQIEVQQADITKLRGRRDRERGQHRAPARWRGGGRDLEGRRPSVQAESDDRAPIGLGEAAETTAGEMPCRWVIHAATMVLGGPTSAEIIRSATASTLAKADELGARSLALVAFGTGVGGFPLDEAAGSRSRRSAATSIRAAGWSESSSPSAAMKRRRPSALR